MPQLQGVLLLLLLLLMLLLPVLPQLLCPLLVVNLNCRPNCLSHHLGVLLHRHEAFTRQEHEGRRTARRSACCCSSRLCCAVLRCAALCWHAVCLGSCLHAGIGPLPLPLRSWIMLCWPCTERLILYSCPGQHRGSLRCSPANDRRSGQAASNSTGLGRDLLEA